MHVHVSQGNFQVCDRLDSYLQGPRWKPIGCRMGPIERKGFLEGTIDWPLCMYRLYIEAKA